MICALFEEIRHTHEINLCVEYFISSWQKGETSKQTLASWIHDILKAKWVRGDEMSSKPGYEESGKTIANYSLHVLDLVGRVIG